MIEFLFLDLDDTILDFHKAERVALEKTLRSLGLEPTDTVMSRYSQINKEHWERLERKEITREFLLVSRFAQLMEEFGIAVSAELCARTYENNLSIGHYFLPGAEEAVERFHIDKLFFSSYALTRDGRILDYSEEETALRKKLLQKAKKRYFLCDSSKFGRTSVFYVADLSEVDRLISDQPFEKEETQ